MAQRCKNDFSDVAVENAIQDLKKIQLKLFDDQSLAKLSPVDRRNNNQFLEEENNNNLDDNGNVGTPTDSPKSLTRMRMAGTANEAMTTSCSESESDDPLELIDRLSANGSGDEGTWLYQSPGSRISSSSSRQTPVRNGRLNESGAGDGPDSAKRRSKASPLDWLRRDFDQTPSPEVEKARHSLVSKVDEITQGRLDTQTFRIRDSRNQARKSLQELINFSGPHQATSTQTSSHECQTEEAGMQTSFLDETQSERGSGFVRSNRYRTFTRKNVAPTILRRGRNNDCPPLNESPQSSTSPRMINGGFDKLSAVEIDVDAVAPEPRRNDHDKYDSTSNDGGGPPCTNGDVKPHVPNLVVDVKSRTFTRPKKSVRPTNMASNVNPEEDAPAVTATDAVNTSMDASISSTEEGAGEDHADFPHIPARVDSATFTRPVKKNVKTKKISRQPLRIPAKKGEVDPAVEGAEERVEEEQSPYLQEPTDGENQDDPDSFNARRTSPRFQTFCKTKGDGVKEKWKPILAPKLAPDLTSSSDSETEAVDKPKILGGATITRANGRRLRPKLRLNGAPEVEEENPGKDEEEDARTRSARLLTTSYTIATHEPGDVNPFEFAATNNDDDDAHDDNVFTPVTPVKQQQQQQQQYQQSRFSRPSQRADAPTHPADSAPGTPSRDLPPTPSSTSSSISSSGGTARRRPTAQSAGDFYDEETPDLEFDESDFLTTLTICSPRSSLPSAEESPRHLRMTSVESRTDSRSNSRSSPIVWDQSNFDKPADMVDVQVMARMQEDSLRRSIVGQNRGGEKPKLTGIVQPLNAQNGHARGGGERNSPLPSPYSKHGSGSPRRTANGATTAEDGYSAKPRIGREDSASSMHSMDSNSGVGGRSGSDSLSAHSGTPPDSPLGGSRSDLQSSSSTRGRGVAAPATGKRTPGGVQQPSSVTRRSLPNLAAQSSGLAPPKAKHTQLSSIRNPQPSLKTHTSDSNLRDKSGLRQPTTSRLKPPTSGLRAPSPAASAAGIRSSSPGGIPKGIVSPTPRSIPAKGASSIARPSRGGSSAIKPVGIPRGGATQPSQPRRSGIQARGSPKNAVPEWEDDYY